MPSLKPDGRRLNGKGGGWIAPPRRLAIYLRDGFLCAYCGTDLHGADRRDVTLDHLVAQVHGGTHHERNLVTACHTCNSKRQHKPWRLFCAPGAVERILRNRRRSIRRQLVLARAIIRGEIPLVEVANNENFPSNV